VDESGEENEPGIRVIGAGLYFLKGEAKDEERKGREKVVNLCS